MAATGIFVITSTTSVSESLSPAQLIFNNLASKYHLEQLPSWTLEHKLFRETPTTGDSSATPPPGWLQVLQQSFDPAGQSYAAITRTDPSEAKLPAQVAEQSKGPVRSKGQGQEQTKEQYDTPAPATILTLPSSSAGEDLSGLLTNRFGPLWSKRQTVQISNGQAYRGEGFTVRFGEVRDSRAGFAGSMGGAGGSGSGIGGQLRSTVAEVTWTGAEPSVEKVKEVWEGLEIKGARQIVGGTGVEPGLELAGVRQWLEALRPRYT